MIIHYNYILNIFSYTIMSKIAPNFLVCLQVVLNPFDFIAKLFAGTELIFSENVGGYCLIIFI